jgi:VIT1/CCC1 family predicted Fe2+/Mn2+ transporter
VTLRAPGGDIAPDEAQNGKRLLTKALKMSGPHKERNRTERIGWLRAAVLGANDGIVSTASLVLGVAAAHGTRSNVLVAGVAGLVAGAMAMAAGEYVSVHSQADTEHAELKRESAELKADDKGEHEELTAIYVDRGLDPSLAKQVAEQLMAHDALGAHARDELGISETLHARPIQAALASASSFAVGVAAPLLVTAIAPTSSLIIVVPLTSLVFLALLGTLAAGAGGANMTVGAIRVTFWGALAMAVTASVGAVFGTIV